MAAAQPGLRKARASMPSTQCEVKRAETPSGAGPTQILQTRSGRGGSNLLGLASAAARRGLGLASLVAIAAIVPSLLCAELIEMQILAHPIAREHLPDGPGVAVVTRDEVRASSILGGAGSDERALGPSLCFDGRAQRRQRGVELLQNLSLDRGGRWLRIESLTQGRRYRQLRRPSWPNLGIEPIGEERFEHQVAARLVIRSMGERSNFAQYTLKGIFREARGHARFDEPLLRLLASRLGGLQSR